MLDTENRTQTVVRAIELAEWLLSAIHEEGATLRLERPDGEKETIKLVGV